MQAEYSQGQSALAHGQATVQSEPAADRLGLVGSDLTQALTPGPGGEVEQGGVLKDQHRLFLLHPTDGLSPMRLQKTLRVELLSFVVEKAIVRLENVAIAPGRLGIRAAGLGGLIRDNLHQALGPSRVAQVTGAELLRGPSRAVQSRVDLQGNQLGALDPHATREIIHQRVQIDVFDALALVMGSVASAAFGLADLDPVRRLVAAAIIGRPIHEALQHPGPKAIAAFEIAIHLPRAQTQYLGSQVLAADTWPDEKPIHVQHPLPILEPLGVGPPDPIITVFQIERRAAKAQAPKPSVIRRDEIAQLSADEPAIPQRMFADHQLIPNPGVFLIHHLDQAESLDLFCPLWNPLGTRDRSIQALWMPASRTTGVRQGELPETLGFEIAQGLACRPDLPVTLGIPQIKTLAELLGQTSARRRRWALEPARDEFDILGLGQRLFDRDGELHPDGLTKRKLDVPPFLRGQGQG